MESRRVIAQGQSYANCQPKDERGRAQRDGRNEERVSAPRTIDGTRGSDGQGLWTCAVGPVMHRCRWIVLHKFMTGECEMRANARTAGRRRIVLASRGGPLHLPRATPPVDVNYRRFHRAEYLPHRGRSRADLSPNDYSSRDRVLHLIYRMSVNS